MLHSAWKFTWAAQNDLAPVDCDVDSLGGFDLTIAAFWLLPPDTAIGTGGIVIFSYEG